MTPTLTIQTHKKELLTTGNVTPLPPPYQPPSKKNPALPNIEPWTLYGCYVQQLTFMILYAFAYHHIVNIIKALLMTLWPDEMT